MLISPSERYEGKLMADLTEEEIQALSARVAEELQTPSYMVLTLEGGLKMMVVDEESAFDYAYVITLYGGYFIQAYIAHENYATLTQEEVTEAVTLMDSIRMLPPLLRAFFGRRNSP